MVGKWGGGEEVIGQEGREKGREEGKGKEGEGKIWRPFMYRQEIRFWGSLLCTRL